MSPRNVSLLLSKEVRDAWRNRWFLLFSAAFALLALVMSRLSLAGVASSGFAGLSRTSVSLVNLVVLVIPLMGLTLGAGGLAAERERGSLLYLLSQPVSRGEVVLGKFLGLAAAAMAALFVGFGVSALAIAGRSGGEGLGSFFAFLGLATALVCASVSVGLLVSAVAARASVAMGAAVVLWLGFVLLGDLGLMGTSVVLRLEVGQLLTAALVNPLQVFKLAAILSIRGGLEVLGPAGLLAERTYGAALAPILVSILALWTLLPLAATAWVMRRRGAL